MSTADDGVGRYRQRRRTHTAIIEATMALLERGTSPSIAEIAEAADMSRRTVYLHFPTLEQLLVDATVGLLSQRTVGDAIAAADPGGENAYARVEAMIRALALDMSEALPLGRQLIKLTVDSPPQSGQPRRGYRRIAWLEQAISPLRDQLTAPAYQRLLSALAMTVGWEANIVLADIRGLSSDEQADTMVWAARAQIDAALAQCRP